MSTIALKMSAARNTGALTKILFSQARGAVLSVLFGHERQSFYLRQLVSTTGVCMGAVQREVKQLLDAGLITKTVSGKQPFYRANLKSPVFKEIKSLVAKTVGVFDKIERANRGSDSMVESDSGRNEVIFGLGEEQEIILEVIGETMGKRRLGIRATKSQLVLSAIRNFIDDCREEEDLKEAIDEARTRIAKCDQ
jgi:DNA-binding transcriptional ArsR family regulator